MRATFAGRDAAALKALEPIRAYDAYFRRCEKTYHVQLQLESIALKGRSAPVSRRWSKRCSSPS